MAPVLLLALLAAGPAVAASDEPPARTAAADSKPETVETALTRALLAAESDSDRESLLAAGGFEVDALAEALLTSFARLNREGRAEASGLAARWALVVAENATDRALLARAWSALGNDRFNAGDYESALRHHGRSLEVAEAIGDTLLTARAHTNIALALGEQGWYDRALEHYQQALALVTKAQSPEGMGIVLTNLGMIYDYRGDLLKALDAYLRSVDIIRERPDFKSAQLGIPLTNVADVFLDLGRNELALRYAREAIASKEAANARWSLPSSFDIAARAEFALGNEAAARADWAKGLALSREVGNRRSEAAMLASLAGLETHLGRTSEGLALYEQALAIASERGFRRKAAALHIDIARSQLALGRQPEALAIARTALREARSLDLAVLRADACAVLGQALLAGGDRQEARASFEEAVAILEEWRDTLGAGEEDLGTLFERPFDPYKALVDLLLEEGRVEEALVQAERSKVRSLVGVLRRGRADLTGALTASEREREAELDARIVSFNAQLQHEQQKAEPDARRLDELRARLRESRADAEAWRLRLYVDHPELRVQRGEAPPLAPADTAALLADGRTALLEYVVGHGAARLFVVTRDPGGAPAVRAFSIPIGADVLASRVEAFRSRLADRAMGVSGEARALYDLLLAPATPALAGRTRLVVVPDGPLWDLPFQALQPSRARYLVEERALSLAPSLTALREMARHQRGLDGAARLLVFADPAPPSRSASGAALDLTPLPEAARQARALGRLYGPAQSRIHLGPDAAEGIAKEEMGAFDVLHFATHGLLDDRNPLYSQLVLAAPAGSAEDGQLEAREILRLSLGASLAVLSACDTGRGQFAPGQGLVGLTWAFFVAGCPSTLVSQWRVDAASTTDLMVAFHREWRAGRPKDEALRRAALRVLRQPRFRHPFYWAGFVVAGDAGALAAPRSRATGERTRAREAWAGRTP